MLADDCQVGVMIGFILGSLTVIGLLGIGAYLVLNGILNGKL